MSTTLTNGMSQITLPLEDMRYSDHLDSEVTFTNLDATVSLWHTQPLPQPEDEEAAMLTLESVVDYVFALESEGEGLPEDAKYFVDGVAQILEIISQSEDGLSLIWVRGFLAMAQGECRCHLCHVDLALEYGIDNLPSITDMGRATFGLLPLSKRHTFEPPSEDESTASGSTA